MQISHYLPRSLPQSLQGLATLALDLRWSWNHRTDELWSKVDAQLWESTANPWLILESVSDHRLFELSQDSAFVSMLQQQLAALDRHLQSQTWFPSQFPSGLGGQVAYFSMEFGLSESLPIYSGGLGVLAGDYLKTACDLDVPVIGIGLLYQQGYFRQSIDDRGEQHEFYPFNDPTMLPVVPLRDDAGEWVRITLELPGRLLHLRSWVAQVGRRSLLLLDSNDLLNTPGDRGITSELYGGGVEMRLQQEMVLGIGGWRLLHRLGLECPVCHLNEGHAAFAVLERVRQFMQDDGQTFEVALRATRAGNLFTTHTPVDAGFDRFPAPLMALYFRDYVQTLGISLEQFLALGRIDPMSNDEPFNMAYLAMRGCAAVNAVSRLHGKVSRAIFQPLFAHWPQAEVPVGYVTNGVHVPSWDSAAADTLWTDTCGKRRWRGELETLETDLRQLDDEPLWRFRSDGRRRLVAFLRRRLLSQHRGRGRSDTEAEQLTSRLDPDALTLGFARRFAEYKRTNLLLQDPERLLRLLCDRDRPVQLVIAGKAHPHDQQGKRLLHDWQQFLQRAEVQCHAVFVEDYDLQVAAQLVQGVDVWINTPRRPMEASGTSGMKVLVNGGLNLSERDGWWAEAYRPDVGWALGDGHEHADTAGWDQQEAEQLFQVLEQQVIPCFYQRDGKGMPRQWIALMRESMACLTAEFSTNRMLRQYVQAYYVPLAQAYQQRTAGLAIELEDWHRHLVQHWPRIHFGNVTTRPVESGYHFDVQVYLDEMSPQAVSVEIYADPSDSAAEPFRQSLDQGELLAGSTHAFVYQGLVVSSRPVSDFTARVVPLHPHANVPLEADLILWYR